MFEVYDIALVPIILGIVELSKRAGLPAKYSPFVAVCLGMIFGVIYLGGTIKEGIMIGLALGLSASGLYSGTKNMLEKGNNGHD